MATDFEKFFSLHLFLRPRFTIGLLLSNPFTVSPLLSSPERSSLTFPHLRLTRPLSNACSENDYPVFRFPSGCAYEQPQTESPAPFSRVFVPDVFE